jgi:thioredoxin
MMNCFRPIPGWRPSTPEIVADDIPSLTASHSAVAIHLWAVWNGYDPPVDENIQAIASQFAGRVHFVSSDIDRAENRSLCERCNLTNVPTIVLFKGDQLKGTIVGMREPNQLTAELESLLTRQFKNRERIWRRCWQIVSGTVQ